MPQARKKPKKAEVTPSRLTHHLKESAFLLSILVAVYLVACLFTYSPTDPGPFSTTNSDHVQNAGRILGAWIADAFLGLTGYIAYLLPVITIFAGWRTWSRKSGESETGVIEIVAVITGLALFLLSSTGLSDMHLLPPAGSMPANGGGVKTNGARQRALVDARLAPHGIQRSVLHRGDARGLRLLQKHGHRNLLQAADMETREVVDLYGHE